MKLLRIERLLRWIWLWPPYWGAGIYVVSFSTPLNDIVIAMPLKKRNINYVGTHFGGNLYSMCDPWYMFILISYLGKDYVVWDKSAKITFVRPGKGRVRARFSISDDRLEEIHLQAQTGNKVLPVFHTEIVDEDNTVIARLEKELYVRRKKPA